MAFFLHPSFDPTYGSLLNGSQFPKAPNFGKLQLPMFSNKDALDYCCYGDDMAQESPL